MTSSTEWYNSIHFRWIVLPVLAYMLSWLMSWGVLLLFPILITIAQYLIFKIHSSVARPGAWFITLPITFFVWIKWGPVAAFSKANDLHYGIAAYYVGQLINALFIPLIIRQGKPELLLNWVLGNLAAATVWLVLYKIVITSWSGDKFHAEVASATFIIYPVIALIANSVSSFFFVRPDDDN